MRSKIKSATIFLTFIVGWGNLLANGNCSATASSAFFFFERQHSPNITSLGADFRDLSKAEVIRLGITGGVLVVAIHAGGALSNQTKMQTGFVITGIGNLPVLSVAGLNNALSRQKSQFNIQGIYPGSKQVVYYSIHAF